jgi:hypothetical protein
MGPGEKPRTSLERFAAEQIGFDDPENSAETIAGLFRKLRDDDFLPDPLAHDAILALAGRPLPLKLDSMLFREGSHIKECELHAKVEQFAAEFFTIPVAQRVDRWKALVEICSSRGRLLERLDGLKSGLTLDVKQIDDPSPLVKRLLDDILALFPMRPSAKAAEARARIERFLTDPKGDDTDRSKALKQLRKRHPEMVALAEGYLTQIARPRRPTRLTGSLAGVKARPAVQHPSPDSGNTRAFVTIAVVLVATVSRLLTSHSTPSTPRPIPPFTGFPVPPVSPTISTAPNLVLREELKGKIRAEITRLGKKIDESQLDRVVAGLPVEVVPNFGGTGMVRLLGGWTEKIRTRFVESLNDGLLETELDLTEKEVDGLIAKCLPNPASESVPQRPPSP